LSFQVGDGLLDMGDWVLHGDLRLCET